MNINQLYTIFPEIILFDINIYLTIKSICIMDIITILYHISIWRQSTKYIFAPPPDTVFITAESSAKL